MDLAERLERLRRLRDAGALGDGDFLAATELLTAAASGRQPAPVHLSLQRLYNLEALAARVDRGEISLERFRALWATTEQEQATIVPGAPIPSPSGPDPATLDEVRHLRALRERGAITEQEYVRALSRVEGGAEAEAYLAGATPAPGATLAEPPPATFEPQAASFGPAAAAPFDARADAASSEPPTPPDWSGSAASPWGESPPGSPPPPPPAVASAPGEGYPTLLEIAYPASLSRLKTLFRGLLVLPLIIPLWVVGGFPYSLTLFARLSTFLKRKYPDWAFAANTGSMGYSARIGAYWLLLTDRYPSFSQEPGGPVQLLFVPPPQGTFSRWRGLAWRYVLCIPHFVCLSFLFVALFFTTVIAWFAILFTGNYPRGLFGFGTGVLRWVARVVSYLTLLNDRFPPFSLAAEARPASHGAVVASGVAGFAAAGLFGAITVVAVIASYNSTELEADYAGLQAGRGAVSGTFEADFGDGQIELTLRRIYDPGAEQVRILRPGRGERIVVFEWLVENDSGSGVRIQGDIDFKVREDDDGDESERTYAAELVTAEDRLVPVTVVERGSAVVRAVFVVPEDAEPVWVRYRGGFAGNGGVLYQFE